jgi:type II secretory pathway component PulC
MLKFFGKLLVFLFLNGLALSVIGWIGYDAWQRGVFENGGLRPVAAAVDPVKEKTALIDIRHVVRSNLFGQEKREVVKKAVVAPPTRLNLKLVGVMARQPLSSSLALIEISRGKQQVVKVGQAIGKSGATLSKVLSNHVLIERNGKLEKLSIERAELKPNSDPGKKTVTAYNNLTAAKKAPIAPSVSSVRKILDVGGDTNDNNKGKIVLPF